MQSKVEALQYRLMLERNTQTPPEVESAHAPPDGDAVGNLR